MNQFNPMSQDNTPHPHQRFFDGAGNNPDQEGAPEHGNPDGYPGPLPNEGAAGDLPPAMPQEDAPAPAPAPSDAPAPAPEPNQEYEGYFNETRERLINVRKERNGIILRIDKLEDQRVEKGSDELDDDSREISKLQSELWRKNNLIDALIKVLISLK